jgi:DNA-binding GntR family transcriptional regulator
MAKTARLDPRKRASNLAADLLAPIRVMISDGKLAAGERINEVHLAEALGVSRTPLREALGHLVAEGALTVRRHFGFYVRPLSVAEFRDIYAVRALLDPEALRLAGVPDEATLKRLSALNRQLARASRAEEAIALDDEWHRRLLDGCGNRVLVELIAQFMARTYRYELALMREQRNLQVATGEHDAILAALRAGQLERACAALRRNLQTGMAPILAWLEARARPAPLPSPLLPPPAPSRPTRLKKKEKQR